MPGSSRGYLKLYKMPGRPYRSRLMKILTRNALMQPQTRCLHTLHNQMRSEMLSNVMCSGTLVSEAKIACAS